VGKIVSAEVRKLVSLKEVRSQELRSQEPRYITSVLTSFQAFVLLRLLKQGIAILG